MREVGAVERWGRVGGMQTRSLRWRSSGFCSTAGITLRWQRLEPLQAGAACSESAWARGCRDRGMEDAT